jgi:hypothetical protein
MIISRLPATKASEPRSWAATGSGPFAATGPDDEWKGWWGDEPAYCAKYDL